MTVYYLISPRGRGLRNENNAQKTHFVANRLPFTVLAELYLFSGFILLSARVVLERAFIRDAVTERRFKY